MADNLANMISSVRSDFAAQAHYTLSSSHGHHFAVHQPKVQQRRAPPPRRELAPMMDDSTPASDPEEQLEQKHKKIAAHNARIGAINTSKASEKQVDEEPSARRGAPKK